jgi:hypothetical protein
MVQNPTFQHSTNIKKLSKNAQKDKEFNLRMHKERKKHKKSNKKTYLKNNRKKKRGTLQP